MVMPITNDRCLEFRGLSLDDKPTEWHGIQLSTGSVFFEIDTSKVFMWDGENHVWKEI